MLPRRVRVTQSLTVEADAVPAGETVRRVDSVPARNRRASRKTSACRQHAGRSTISRPNRRCNAPCTCSARREAGKPTEFYVTLRTHDLRAVPRRSIRRRSCRCDDAHAGTRAVRSPNARRTSCSPTRCASSRARPSATKRIPYRDRAASCSPRSTTVPVGRRARVLDDLQHQRLRAARRPRRLRPADAAADDAAAPQRHSRALAVGHGVLATTRLRQPARLGPGVSRAVWLGADGRDLRPPGQATRHIAMVLPRRARRAIASRSTTTTAVDFVPAQDSTSVPTPSTLQRGEVEWRGGNLYFDQLDYDFEWNLVPTLTLGRTAVAESSWLRRPPAVGTGRRYLGRWHGWPRRCEPKPSATRTASCYACRRGLDVIDEYRSMLGSSELRAQTTAHGAELASLGQRHALGLGRPRLMLAWSERWRAVALAVPPVRPPADDELQAELAAMRDISSRLSQATSLGVADRCAPPRTTTAGTGGTRSSTPHCRYRSRRRLARRSQRIRRFQPAG